MQAFETMKKDTPCPWGCGKTNMKGETLTIREKYWLGSRVVFGVCTTKRLHARFGIPLRTLQKFAQHFREGLPLHERAGAPATFDTMSCSAIQAKLSDPDYVMTAPEYRKVLVEEAVLTADRRMIPYCQQTEPSGRTIRRVTNRLDVNTGFGEETTKARALACADIRNAVSFAAMNSLMVPL